MKLRAHYKRDTHKRYLQKYFPYYVFPSIVMDLEGNIVLFINTQKQQNTYSNNILYIQQDFANSQPEFIEKVQKYINIYSTIHEVKYVDIKDLYYHFYKEYIFKDISEVDDFKKKFSIFAKEHLEKRIEQIQIDEEPF
jgi:ribosomal protein L31